ncbi:MAG: hypothetical protein K1Y02_14200 [Candidatus Hydrogenedentes bacterium]|nr:hypothetical protein [Candidatus Hydrogenedentota bacterium]
MKKTKEISKPRLYIEELERPALAGTATTLSIGEEGGKFGWATTLAIGEEATKGL